MVVDIIEPAHASGDALAAEEEHLITIKDALRQLPVLPVKDLLNAGVCLRCVFRLFGIRGQVYSCHFPSPSVIYSLLEAIRNVDEPILLKTGEANGGIRGPEKDVGLCCICFGILQFSPRDANGEVVMNQSIFEMVSMIGRFVKEEGHSVDDFSLEISVPPAILENEHAARLHLKSKYGNEDWMQETTSCQVISVKEALKFSLVSLIEKELDAKSTLSEFRVRLTYTHNILSKTIQNIMDKNQSCKKLKHGNDKLHNGGHDADVTNDGAEEIIRSALNNLGDREHSAFPPDKVTQPCSLTVACSRASIYFGGRYLKYSRNVSQSRWIIDDERMGEASVEEIIGNSILPLCRGDAYKFHAAGREDIDVRMLGSGRPFLVEVQNARHVPSLTLVKEIEAKVNSAGNGLVKVKNLDLVGSQGWNLMREGEAEKQKQYAALVWISRPIEDADIEAIVSLKELQILQKTPVRVLHRRSPLERGRTIHWMEVERIAGTSQYFLLHLCTQAGTYIKEFVHGDFGRTHPSIGSILGCRAEILRLDVTDVKMDCFLID